MPDKRENLRKGQDPEADPQEEGLKQALKRAVEEVTSAKWSSGAKTYLERSLFLFVKAGAIACRYDFSNARGPQILEILEQELFRSRQLKDDPDESQTELDLFRGIRRELRIQYGLNTAETPRKTFIETFTILRTGHTSKELSLLSSVVKINDPLRSSTSEKDRRSEVPPEKRRDFKTKP